MRDPSLNASVSKAWRNCDGVILRLRSSGQAGKYSKTENSGACAGASCQKHEPLCKGQTEDLLVLAALALATLTTLLAALARLVGLVLLTALILATLLAAALMLAALVLWIIAFIRHDVDPSAR
jgi:hypothetical protein